MLKRKEAELFLKPITIGSTTFQKKKKTVIDKPRVKRVQLLPEKYNTEARTAQELNGNNAVALKLLNPIRTSLNKL